MPFGMLCCMKPGVEDIVELDYSNQSLTDVPSEVFVHERTLETLFCQSNRITELPRQLFMCHGLKYLDLGDNELQNIPAAISSLVHLQHFNINRNTLATLPDTMKALKYLKFLDLSVNPLEKLPDAITNLMALQELFLNDTYLEYLPGNFGRLSNLRILELRDNYLMILPKSLSRSTDLLRLDIGQNEFQEFPDVIGRFFKLKELWIDCNSLGNLPDLIKTLENLQHLEASNNMIEEISPEIGHCTKLVDLSLTANCLTQLPDTIGHLCNLTSLKLDNNRLYSLPQSIGFLKNLEELMLMCNYLDQLPSSIGLLRNLHYLNLDENLLIALPPEIGSCIKLSVLSVRSNKLIKIPPELGHLSNLKVLNLVRNSLTHLPQALLNCENLVALWLSENQSKPLLHMQSEIDPVTYEPVLTCLLFPQVPTSLNETKHENEKTENSEAQSSRHISFVDMKTAPKVLEKPGQLRRAPTPYPKELRALAKHARNIQKDSTQDITPPVPSAVIKAAKITPTLQQRFASDNKKDIENENVDKTDSAIQDNRKSVYDNIPNDTYDKPLNYEQDQTYKAIDHSLYTNSNEESNQINVQHHQQGQYNLCHNEPYVSKHDLQKTILPATQKIYGRDIEQSNYNQDTSSYRFNANDAQRNMQRLSLCSQDSKVSRADSKYEKLVYSQIPLTENISNYELAHLKQEPLHIASNYHDGVYIGDTYMKAREKIYGHRNYDVYGYHKHGSHDLASPKVPTVSQVVSNSSTMPNLSNYNSYAGTDVGNHYQMSRHPACPTSYSMQPSSPTYVSTQSPELYSPTGHTNLTNPYRLTNTPLVSEDGSYSHIHNPGNMYDIYDAMSTSSHTPSVHNQQGSSTVSQIIFGRGQPPPYHVAAPYTKHAQYFNGTGG